MTVQPASITRSWPFTTNRGALAYSISTIGFTAANPTPIDTFIRSMRTAFGITPSRRRCRSDVSEESVNGPFVARQSCSKIQIPRMDTPRFRTARSSIGVKRARLDAMIRRYNSRPFGTPEVSTACTLASRSWNRSSSAGVPRGIANPDREAYSRCSPRNCGSSSYVHD